MKAPKSRGFVWSSAMPAAKARVMSSGMALADKARHAMAAVAAMGFHHNGRRQGKGRQG